MKEKLKQIEKKKLYLAGGFLVLIVVILFGGAFIYNQFFYKRSYSEIEEIMVGASKKYLSSNRDKLPKNYNEVFTLSENDLVSGEYMKTIAEYLKDDSITCAGNVVVTNINGEYRYTPSLDCGDKYKTVKFIDYIKKMVPVATEGNGLYNMNDELVYRGDEVNNYLKFSGKTYRIVKFSEDSAVIIYTEKPDSIVWDDRYNVEKSSNLGINDYSVSRVKSYVDKLYKGNSILTEEKKMLVVAHSLNIGKRAVKDTDKTLGLEKSAVIENQFIGLLPLGDYLNASLDKNCTTSVSASCMNYNYLSKFRYPWWTITGTNENTHQVYKIAATGSASLATASSSGYIRHVLYLTKDALYVSGDGTSKNPYILK